MLYFKEEVRGTDGKDFFVYKGTTVEQIQHEAEMLMISMGYKHLTAGIFEKGNRTLRILFGAFCKYFKFRIVIEPYNADEVKVKIEKETTGMSGGAIGMNQVKNEYNNLLTAFRAI